MPERISLSSDPGAGQPNPVVAMSVHALSAAYRQRLEREARRPPVYVLISSLRRLGMIGALRELRRMQPDLLLVAFEDADSEVLIPILRCIAFVTRARRIELIDPKFVRSVQSRLGAVESLVRLVGASVAGLVSYLLARGHVRGLLAAPPVRQAAPNTSDVLYVNTNLWFGVKAGGSVGHIAGVANEMHRCGVRVQYVSVSNSTQIDAAVERGILTAHRSHGLPPELNSYRFGQSAFRQIVRLRDSRPPDLIYQRMSVCDYTGARLARRLGVPLVLEYNGSEVWTARHWGRPMIFESLAVGAELASLRHAQLIVTVSAALEDQLVSAGVPREKIVVYPNCVDATVFDPARFSFESRAALLATQGFGADDVVVGFIGTFGKWHGVDILAAAIRTMLDDQGAWVEARRVRFLFVGDGQGMPEVRRILGAHASGPFVRLTGLVAQNEAPAYLAATDVLVSPHTPNADGSAFFGSPTKLFEYMAMGRAIVASDLDQLGKVLEQSVRAAALPSILPNAGDNSVAVLTSPGDVPELVRAIQFTVDQPDWRKHLGANARREVLRKYTWAHHVDAIFRRLAESGPVTGAVK